MTHGDLALAQATDPQRAAYRRLRDRCSIRGVIRYTDGTLQVGFESSQGRDREAVIAPNGSRLETRNTYA